MHQSENRWFNDVNNLSTKFNLDEKMMLNNKIQTIFKETSELQGGLELKLQDLYGERNLRLMDSKFVYLRSCIYLFQDTFYIYFLELPSFDVNAIIRFIIKRCIRGT